MCSELLAQNFPPCDLWTTAQHMSQGVSPVIDSGDLQSARELSVADTSMFQVLTHRQLLYQTVRENVGGMVSKEKAYSDPLKAKQLTSFQMKALYEGKAKEKLKNAALRKSRAEVKHLGSCSPSLS